MEPRAGLQGGLVDRGEVLHERVPLLELLRLLLLLLLQLFVFGGVGVGAGNRSGQRRRRLRRRRSLLELALWLLLLLLVIHRRLLLRGGQGVVRDPGEERGHCFSRGFFALRENKGGGGGLSRSVKKERGKQNTTSIAVAPSERKTEEVDSHSHFAFSPAGAFVTPPFHPSTDTETNITLAFAIDR